jgi:hypothetical protein
MLMCGRLVHGGMLQHACSCLAAPATASCQPIAMRGCENDFVEFTLGTYWKDPKVIQNLQPQHRQDVLNPQMLSLPRKEAAQITR